jgi:hypothetical protein
MRSKWQWQEEAKVRAVKTEIGKVGEEVKRKF